MRNILLVIIVSCSQLAVAAGKDDPGRIEALTRVGDYRSALALNRYLLTTNPDTSLINRLAELEFTTGKLSAAENNFKQVIAADDAHGLIAKLNLARIYRGTGRLRSAEALFDDILSAYRTRAALSVRDLYAVAGASRYLGDSDPQLFKQAVRIYTEANREDPADLNANIALGELLLEKYNNEEALEVFKEVLAQDSEHPRALLGLARSQHFDYSSEALLTVQKALEINPNLVAARVFLSRLFIELEQYSAAHKEAELALQVNPLSLEAMSMLAAVYYLQGNTDEFEAIEKRVLALNPQYAGLYTTLADLAAQNRLYREAVEFSQTAVQLDSRSWRAYGLLGMNQMRLGLMREARDNLERSFEGDPYNVWINNTLQLGDRFRDFVEVDEERFQVVMHGSENRLLDEYVHDLAENAYNFFKARYRHEPALPIRIELYPDHADFSVRSVGIAGVGLLGVCFGPVVAMDSPAAREKGAFNWGSTLWHELAHVFHLSVTDNRVPRWFSEGLSVYEERAARTGWGADVTPDFLIAYLEGRLLPLSQLNNGFVRPSYPQQVIHSYFQASLVFEFIEARWGFDVIREILNAYRGSLDHDKILPAALKLDAESLDEDFDSFMRDKYATALQALRDDGAAAPDSTEITDNYYQQIEMGRLLMEKGDLVLAESFLSKAQMLFPEYAGDDSSYWLLATLYSKQDRPLLAEQQLAKMVDINAEHYDAHLRLAELRAERDDAAGAADVLERAIYIYPYDEQLHQQLASYRADQGLWEQVARERRALLALDPVDKAEAYFQLAYAYERGGDRSSAREQIIYALEIAPSFYRAQELLLSLIESESSATREVN